MASDEKQPTLGDGLRLLAECVQCPICLDTFDEPWGTTCAHTFCRECLMMSLKRGNSCPQCKFPINKRSSSKSTAMASVVEAYQTIRNAYDELMENEEVAAQLNATKREARNEYGEGGVEYRLSPQADLSQRYPYPEKADDKRAEKPETAQKTEVPDVGDDASSHTEEASSSQAPARERVPPAAPRSFAISTGDFLVDSDEEADGADDDSDDEDYELTQPKSAKKKTPKKAQRKSPQKSPAPESSMKDVVVQSTPETSMGGREGPSTSAVEARVEESPESDIVPSTYRGKTSPGTEATTPGFDQPIRSKLMRPRSSGKQTVQRNLFYEVSPNVPRPTLSAKGGADVKVGAGKGRLLLPADNSESNKENSGSNDSDGLLTSDAPLLNKQEKQSLRNFDRALAAEEKRLLQRLPGTSTVFSIENLRRCARQFDTKEKAVSFLTSTRKAPSELAETVHVADAALSTPERSERINNTPNSPVSTTLEADGKEAANRSTSLSASKRSLRRTMKPPARLGTSPDGSSRFTVPDKSQWASPVRSTRSVRSRQSTSQSGKPVVLTTGLPHPWRHLQKFCAQSGAVIARDMSPEVTHIVTSVCNHHGSVMARGRTFKYMFGVVRGCWIVSDEWVKQCLELKTWVPEEAFEVAGDGSSKCSNLVARTERRQWQMSSSGDAVHGLFHETCFYVPTTFCPRTLCSSMRQFAAVLEAGDATVYTDDDIGRFLASVATSPGTVRHVVLLPEDLAPAAVLQMLPEKHVPAVERAYSEGNVVFAKHHFVAECVSLYKFLDIDSFSVPIDGANVSPSVSKRLLRSRTPNSRSRKRTRVSL